MNFAKRAIVALKKIPEGRVATYGLLAASISTPRAARAIGLVLSKFKADSQIPWYRVINSKGMISIENLAVPKQEQARRLQKEGVRVEFRNGNYWVDLKKYLWKFKS